MASNLDYLYRLRDDYSKKMEKIIKTTVKFEQTYRKGMGKVNSAIKHNIQKVREQAEVHKKANRTIVGGASKLAKLTKKTNEYNRAALQIKKSTEAWEKNSRAIRKNSQNLSKNRSRQRGGGLASMATGIGGGFFLMGAIKLSAEFHQNLNAIKARLPEVDFDLMKKKAMNWGLTTQSSAIQVAGAMAEAASTGMTQNEILSKMEGNLALAAAGSMTLVDAMVLSTDVVNQFDKTVSNLDIADQLATGAAKSTSKVVELGSALKNVGSIAFQAGLTSVDTIKMLMILGETGLRGEIGGTFLKNMIMQMKMMPKKLKKGFKNFLKGTGVSLSDIINIETGKIVDPDEFNRLLIAASDKQLTALTTAIGMRGGMAVGALSLVSVEKLKEFDKAMQNTEGQAHRMAKILLEGLPGGIILLNSAWETSKIVMVDSFIEPLSKAMRKVANFLAMLSDTHKWVLTLTFGLVGLATLLGLIGLIAFITSGTVGNLKLTYAGLKKVVTSNTVAFIWQKGVMIATALWSGIVAIATGAWTAAQWLLNAAFAASPITLVLIAIAAMIAIIVIAIVKLKSWGAAFKFLGQLILKTLLQPINLVVFAIQKLLQAASHLPFALGDMAGKASDKLKSVQDEINLKLTGNKSITAAGMMYDLIKMETPGASEKVNLESKKASEARSDRDRKIENVLTGNISVKAEQGTEVTKSGFSIFNRGENLAFGS